MIVSVGDIVTSYLEPYRVGGEGSNQFIDKLAGVVKTVVKTDLDKDNKPLKKTFPVSMDTSLNDCMTTGRYKDLIPNSNVGCMVYLESISNVYTGNMGRKNDWKAQYRLVCWINQKKLGFNEDSITARIITTFLNSFPVNPTNHGLFQSCVINVTAEDSRDVNPFLKYSYDEDKTQYLMHPYDYFSLQMEVTYQIDRNCITPFSREAEQPC